MITNEVFMIQIGKDTSVIKFGGYDKLSVPNGLTVLECSDSSSYLLDVSQTLVNNKNALTTEYIRTVRLDYT